MNSQSMQTMLYEPQKGLRLQERALPRIGPDEALLKVLACGICGTDLLKVDQQIPRKPVVLGHELCGEVVALGADVTKFAMGDRLVVAHHVPCQDCHYCRHGNPSMCFDFKQSNLDPGGFSQYLRVPAPHLEHTAFLVPEHLSHEEALMTEPLACCLRNLQRAKLQKGDLVVIVGMGSIGLMSLQALCLQGCQVIGLDLQASRRDLSLTLGASASFETTDQDFASKIQELSQGRGADLVIFTAGNSALLSQSLDWLRDGGAINIFASLKDSENAPINFKKIYHREISLFSSYSPSLTSLQEAFKLIKEKKINLKALLSHQLALSDLEKGLELMRQQQAFKVILKPF